MSTTELSTIPQAVEAIKNGDIVILVDDEDRENEGDFIFAADLATPDKVNFLAKCGRGMICVAAERDWLERLNLHAYPAERNTALMGTNFTMDTVDARDGVSSGISAADRCRTIQVLADPQTVPADLARPGHIFPIVARKGGTLIRAGHTEGTVDLCRMAGRQPVGVLCEIMNDDGAMARLPDLLALAREHNLHVVTIRDLIAWRRGHEKHIKKIVDVPLPNEYGMWQLALYEDELLDEQHVTLTMGEVTEEPILVRMHSMCFTGDTLGSLRCDCGPQLQRAMKLIGDEGRGVIVYLHQEGRGIGLKNKLFAYQLQDQGQDTVEANEQLGFKADLREYGVGAQILVDLGVRNMRLMTNNPRKIVGLDAFGLKITEAVPISVGRNPHNEKYLDAKRDRMGHQFTK